MTFLPTNRVIFFFLPFLLLLLFFSTSTSPVFSQECFVNIPSDQTLGSYCAQEGEANWNPTCSVQGNTCPGTKTSSGGTVGECWACVSNPTATPESCTLTSSITSQNCKDLGYTITNNGKGKCSEPQVTCTGKRSDGCNYCVAPLCPGSNSCYNGDPSGDAGDVNCVPCSNITCSVDANATGETSGQANSSVTAGQHDGYDSVNWYLNNSLIGTTAMNADGTASNSFTSLQSNTTYEVKAEYFDNQGGRPATSCTDPFTTGGQMTCSLSVVPNTIDSGGSATWSIQNSPAGSTATWGGTNPDGSSVSAPVQGYSDTTSWSATYTYNTSGSYQRYAQIKNSSGTTVCTTDTVQLSVNPQACSANPVSVSPTSMSLTIGGSGQGVSASGTKGTVSWSSGNTSVAAISPSLGTLTTVSPGTTAGTTSVTAADQRSGGTTCRASTAVSVSGGTACPGQINACGDSAYGGLTPSATSLNGCDGAGGTWTYPGNETYDEWCDSQKKLAADKDGYYCYQCNPATGGPGPSPTPGPISAGFTTGSIVVKGTLLLGRILQDINASFSIDSPDELIEKLTSIVSGKVRTTLGLLDITGRMQNVLAHGAAVYHMWTNLCTFGCSLDDQAVQQEIVTGTGAGSGGSSNFIKVLSKTECLVSSGSGSGCKAPSGTNGSYTSLTTTASDPVDGFFSTLRKAVDYTAPNSRGFGSSASYIDTLAYNPGNVTNGSCATGCTVQSKLEVSYSTDPTSCGSEPAPNTANTHFHGVSYPGSDSSVSWNYYESCTKYTFGGRTGVSPWSVSFTSPVVVSSGSLAINNWYNLFEIVDPESCTYDANWKPQVNPTDAQQYCTCDLYDSCSGGCITATFDCNFPLKSGKSFGDAPTGDYIFEVTASTDKPVGYEITAGGSLARGSQAPSGGKLSIKFNVPDSAIGQRINITLNQTGGNFEEVTFGPPALYPVGWYEASINFGRTATTGLSQARVIDPPEDYPYTIGMIPPAGNYCSKTANLEQCYLSLSAAPLNSTNISQVDFLLGNIKAGGWFQVKDADLQAVGSLVSNIPSSCKTPKCTPQFDLAGPGGFPGVPAYSTTSSFGSGTVSGKGWLAKSGYAGKRFDFAYFRSLANSSGRAIDLRGRFAGKIGADGILTLEKSDLSDLAGTDEANFAVFDGRIVLADSSGIINLEKKKLVILASGDVLIQSRINLSDGEGFFGIFGGASIIVDPGVKSENPNQYGLEGVFLADGAIHTGTKNPIPSSGDPDNQLYIRGMLAAWQGVQLQRDLDPTRSTGANNDKPAEFIEYAPDLVLNFPKELLRQGNVWREVAP